MPKVFDREDAMTRVEQDSQLLSELMDIFLTEYQDYLTAIDNAIISKDTKKITENAHSIKSALGNIGAASSFELAKNLEFAARKDQLEKAVGFSAALKTEVGKFLVEIEKFKSA
ncbi:MAG: Hpt domain-containing protein [Bdellovibrionales bacterium]|nr:Hpt domain-containing protein [Bdellovibrionales bacterium]